MKVAFIRDMENKRIRIGIESGDDVVRYSVSEATLAATGLVRGCEVSAEMLELIAADDEKYRAMRRALSLLSYGDNTKGALFSKLLRAGFGREIAEECVAECMRLGYIDERRQIERAVINEANRSLKGRDYILRKLRSKGYSSSDIISVMDELCESGEVDFAASFELLCEKKGVSSDEERRALSYKYGYRSSDFD